jgi:microcystin-dependent protein
MSEPLIGEIRIVPYNFAPRNWAWCEGQLVSIGQWQALFAVIGTIYGGNGSSNFALPDLKGRVPLGYGQSPGTSYYPIAQQDGFESVSLATNQLPSHTHEMYAFKGLGTSTTPDGNSTFGVYQNNRLYYRSPTPAVLTAMSDAALTTAGKSDPHENRQPYLVLNFCIALEGIFPARS